MSSNRSAWSCFVLSLAVTTACVLPSAQAQEAATPPAAATAAPDADLVQQAEDFLHYTRVNSVEMAKGVGEKLAADGVSAPKLLQAFEAAASGRDFRGIVEGATRREELKDVATKVLAKIDAGYRESIRNRERILAEVKRLGQGPRPYQNAKDRLTAAGQYAVPVLISVLQDNAQKDLHPHVLRVMTEIGRPMLPPILEQLNMSEQASKATLVNVVGEMGQRQALPVLVKLTKDPKTSEEVKSAATRAIAAITRNKPVTASPAELYLEAAQKTFDRAPGFQAPNAEESTNAVWVYRKDIDNVVGTPVPTAIWADIQTQRYAEQSIQLQPDNAGAISLWIAAGFKRELDLPSGEKDPLKDDAKITAATIAYASGAVYLNPVLAMAIEHNDSALILRSLDALEKVAGIVGLAPGRDANKTAEGPQSPAIVRSLSYPDRAVRFKAAEILARVNPSERFPGYFRVVPVLAEAISQTGSPTVLLVDSDNEHRLKLKDALRNSAAAYNVIDGPTLAVALEAGKKAAAFDMIVITNGPDVAHVRESARSDYRLVNPPMVLMVPASQQNAVKADLAGAKGVAVIPSDTAEEPVVTQAAATARGSAGNQIDQTKATEYAVTAINAIGTLAFDKGTIYRVEDAQPALTDALKDKRPEIATAAAGVLGKFSNAEAQRSLAGAAFAAEVTDATVRAAVFNGIAESAKRIGNSLDAAQIDKIIKTVSTETDATVRDAAARALGALNVPSNQASELIRMQTAK